jgi:hypothetical protein
MLFLARSLYPLALSAALVSMLSVSGCAAGEGGADSEELLAAPETANASSEAVSGSLPAGTSLTATSNVNLRASPSTSSAVLHVVPKGSSVTLEQSAPSSGFYKVKHSGTVGWSFGQYYEAAKSPGGTGSPGAEISREVALARAKTAMGFSYWWGHGRFVTTGATSSNHGACAGSCPSCSHSGQYGGDCSGLVGKAWLVQGSNADLSVDAHPYSTASFVTDSSQWSTIDRGAVKPADAMVYNENGKGHIFLYESGDGWGSMYAYECKACAEGCVHDLRTASSAYKAIRRAGF